MTPHDATIPAHLWNVCRGDQRGGCAFPLWPTEWDAEHSHLSFFYFGSQTRSRSLSDPSIKHNQAQPCDGARIPPDFLTILQHQALDPGWRRMKADRGKKSWKGGTPWLNRNGCLHRFVPCWDVRKCFDWFWLVLIASFIYPMVCMDIIMKKFMHKLAHGEGNAS